MAISKGGCLVLEKILKFRKSIFAISISLWKGWGLHLIKLESPSLKDALCKVGLKLAQWFWRRGWKCEKWTDRWMARRRTTGDQKSSLELLAQVSYQGTMWKVKLSFQIPWSNSMKQPAFFVQPQCEKKNPPENNIGCNSCKNQSTKAILHLICTYTWYSTRNQTFNFSHIELISRKLTRKWKNNKHTYTLYAPVGTWLAGKDMFMRPW